MYSYWHVYSVLYTLCQLAFSGYPDWGFSVLFSSVVRQMPGHTSQTWDTVRTLPKQWTVLFYVLFVSIGLFYILFVCKCVLYYCHRVSTQLQLNISYIIYIIPYIISCILSYHMCVSSFNFFLRSIRSLYQCLVCLRTRWTTHEVCTVAMINRPI
jgi:hypothetical protein